MSKSPEKSLLGSVILCAAVLSASCKSDSSASNEDETGPGGANGSGGGDSSGGTDGGSGDVPSDLQTVSGARLKQVWLEGGGTARAERIYDSELEVDCRFETLEDGSLRCAPLNSEAIVFSDDQCTEALFPDYIGDCGETPSDFSGIFLPREDCGPSIFRVYRADNSVDTPDTVYRLDSGECVAETADPDNKYFSASVVEPSEFVEAQQVVDERTDQLGVRFYSTSDGGYFYEGPVNLERNERCGVSPLGRVAAPSSAACVVGTAFSFEGARYGFSDDACSQPVAYGGSSCVEPEAVLVTETDGDSCTTLQVFESAGELSSVYEDQDGSCEETLAAEFSPPGRRFAIGGAATDLIELDVEEASSDGPLTRRQYTFDGEPIQFLYGFWDIEAQSPCSQITLPTGEITCLPGRHVNLGSTINSGIFADEECTREIVFGGNVGPCPNNEPFTYIIVQSDDICVPSGTIYEAGETFVTDTIYLAGNGTCDPQIDPNEGYWAEVGPQVDVETVVTLTERIDD